MRKIALSVATITATLLTALPLTSTGASAAPPAAPSADSATGALDARRAAPAKGVVPIGTFASWFTGTVAAGATQGWVWNNANPLNAAHKVGLSPIGASTAAPCQFEVIRSWYVQEFSGERRFFFNIKNIGTIACGANVLLSQINAFTSWSSGGVNPGASQGWTWNNANPLNASHLVGLSPTGATSTATCQFEVTRSWYSRQPSGERRFHFTIRNVGTIACVATILLASTTTSTSWSNGSLAPGGIAGWTWNNANPLNLVYLPGLNPAIVGAGACQLEVVRSYYVQRINPDGSAQRQFVLNVQNVGSFTCNGTVLLASIAA
jgi:hypothetical protein